MKLQVSTEHKCLNKFAMYKYALKETVDGEINASIWFHCNNKETMSLIEDERKDKVQRSQTRQNPKRYIPLVSFLL